MFHVLFWAAYLAQDTLLSYLWDAPRLTALDVPTRAWIAFKLCAALIPPKIAFTYLLIYVVLDRILTDNRRLLQNLLQLLAMVLVTLFLLRVITVYVIHPYVYGSLSRIPPFFTPFAFLFEIIDLGFVSGMAIAIRQIRLQLEGKEREKALIREKLEAELKFLKNQTNPHFLFNTLNNIYALARKKSDSTADVVMKLSKILRFMLYESGRTFISIAEEIKLMEDYIDLEKIRYNQQLNVVFTKEIDNAEQEMSPLLLLPFIENAFKHGASESFFDASIHIIIRLQEGQLFFYIENSKEEESSADARGNNIGLTNIKRQLELMYTDHRLLVNNQPKKFIVQLNVNLHKHGEI